MLPLILKRLGADPATSSAPFVATLVDVTGFGHILFCGLYLFAGYTAVVKMNDMKHCRLLFLFLLFTNIVSAQEITAPLTVEKIMRDPKWIGSSPAEPEWSSDGKVLYFKWNPDRSPPADSLYMYAKANGAISKVPVALKNDILYADNLVYNKKRSQYVFAKDGDVFWGDVKSGVVKQVTATAVTESGPVFSFGNECVVYEGEHNLFAWNVQSGTTTQLSNFQAAAVPPTDEIKKATRRRNG